MQGTKRKRYEHKSADRPATTEEMRRAIMVGKRVKTRWGDAYLYKGELYVPETETRK